MNSSEASPAQTGAEGEAEVPHLDLSGETPTSRADLGLGSEGGRR